MNNERIRSDQYSKVKTSKLSRTEEYGNDEKYTLKRSNQSQEKYLNEEKKTLLLDILVFTRNDINR